MQLSKPEPKGSLSEEEKSYADDIAKRVNGKRSGHVNEEDLSDEELFAKQVADIANAKQA
ncbi:hypothetical protein J2R98_002325 [Alkalibacillus filiformis]|uniref:YfhD-like protein n=1 Tax=Alkalibacillus filiformis TaxID=200990 RepID=A0ABU0DW31_9BACI|nr:hypothetical protein [Alkalibacillus filiformis]MDQ0352481.1 hypothetical protein [Alkalibacillus filiformis]